MLALTPVVALALGLVALGRPAENAQLTLSTSSSPQGWTAPIQDVDSTILAVLESHDDPVEALLALQPELYDALSEPRLLDVLGESTPKWMTEGDKLRLRREGKDFVDLTDHQDVLLSGLVPVESPYTPNLTQQTWIRPCFEDIDLDRMRGVVKHMSSYYNRYFASVHGEKSARWLHDHIAEIIAASPFQTYISLEYMTHKFRQPSIIARFEPASRNASLPLTIIGAHQDSANYKFPLLPAPGADDDLSGTVTILEAFRILAQRGFIPERGPVEFQWYAAEEAGLLGSMDIARYKKDTGASISAMLEFDMTAFIPANTTETINFITDEADPSLTDWLINVSKTYVDIETTSSSLHGLSARSDYMSFTWMGYPSAFATEADFEFEMPYAHTVKDRMDLDDETGVYSISHMAQFTKLAIAYVVEQAGWSLKHTRREDIPGAGAWRIEL